ncbi:twin-arginine translocase TatA/TatE family subunit [Roseospira navarrensis]|uniref:Sec-independent protein translocase protein TatA n=1 Tax=Roseospira navarrensis TaxID=140058 RepID=A0A7X2D1V2_9PROT|nr:twin-arginine translocase TatA/TatE family subunit [Roseospira navarrensis]MQX35574.1 twin-arginine translocase TatA/TatE family subunit [Roseospira navarrensis]
MGTFSIWHWIIVLVVVLLLFGAGKIPRLMGDVAKGVKAFKKGMADDDDDGDKKIEESGSTNASTSAADKKKDESVRS